MKLNRKCEFAAAAAFVGGPAVTLGLTYAAIRLTPYEMRHAIGLALIGLGLALVGVFCAMTAYAKCRRE